MSVMLLACIAGPLKEMGALQEKERLEERASKRIEESALSIMLRVGLAVFSLYCDLQGTLITVTFDVAMSLTSKYFKETPM